MSSPFNREELAIICRYSSTQEIPADPFGRAIVALYLFMLNHGAFDGVGQGG